MKKLTVIIPCFNEEEALPIYYQEMSKVMAEMPDLAAKVVLQMIVIGMNYIISKLYIFREDKR